MKKKKKNFFNDTATTEIYALSLHDALPISVYGDFGTTTRIPTVAINVKGFTPEEVKVFMRKNNIAIRSGDCGCPKLMESLGAGQEGVARFSFGYFNTRMEVNDAIWTLMKQIGRAHV